MSAPSKKVSIAIVDDQQSLCKLYSIISKKNGDVVFTGNSGEEILAAVAEGELTKGNLGAQVFAGRFSFIRKPFYVYEFLKCLVNGEHDEKESGLRKRKTDFSLAIEDE